MKSVSFLSLLVATCLALPHGLHAQFVNNGDMSGHSGEKLDNWQVIGGDAAKRSISRDTQVFKSAPAALRLDIDGTEAAVNQRLGGNPAGKKLSASIQARAEGDFKQIQLYAQSFDKDWKQLGWKTMGFLHKRGEWAGVSGSVELEPNAANILFGILVKGEGKVWLDDVTLIDPAAPPPVERKPVALLGQEIAPADSKLLYSGRWDFRDGAGPRAAWSGSAAAIRFKGTRLNVRLKESNATRYEVFIDGKRADTLVPEKGSHWYCVAENLPDAEHTVMLVKRTEVFFGTAQILGWQLDPSATLLKAEAPKRLIEVIGDSITCGYGNEAANKEEKFSAVTESAASAYGFLAAKDLGAAYSGIAWSGKKLWPNNSIVELYDRALALDASSAWDYSKAQKPDVVVINLGTNDFSGGAPEEDGWVGAYIDFIRRLRKNYPGARIYCAVGPMMHGKSLATIRGYLGRVVKEGGDKNIAFLEFKMQDGSTGYGADWHPSNATHRRMADTLANAIRNDLGWK